MINFKFSIGDHVGNLSSIEEVDKFYEYTDIEPRPMLLVVEERISIECIGGVQLFYSTRTTDGRVLKFPDAMLVSAELMWTAWLKSGSRASERRRNMQKETRPL